MLSVLGVDSSTSACKVQVHDVNSGAVLASGRAPHPTTTPPRSEQWPAAWNEAFHLACDRAGVGARIQPTAMSVAAQQHGLVVLGPDGNVLRPAKLWNDTESAEDAAALLSESPGGAAAWAHACGSVPLASFTISKLRWLRRAEPHVFEKTSTILLPHDWLTWRLTGQKVTDRGDASGTGYWSPSEERYRPDLLCTIDDTRDWDSMLPTVLGPTTVAGEWRETGAIVAAGTGDNMAAALGLGLSSRDFALSFGTSCTAFTVREMPSADSTGVVAGFADATGRFLPLACTMNGTKVLETVARLLGVDNRTFDELALAAPPGAGGLILVPYLDGERTPSRPTSTGTFLGLRSDVMPAQVARAAVEGIVCNLLIAAAPLWPSEDGDGRILLAGGGAHSRALQRVVADLTGRLVHVHICDELVARGAALQAAAVLQGREIGDVMRDWALQPDEIVEPDDTVDRSSILGEYREAALSY